MSKFVWGKIVNRHDVIIGDYTFEVIEYYPFIDGSKQTGYGETKYEDKVKFYVKDLSSSWDTLMQAAVGIITYLAQGINSYSLALGISRMLEV